MWRDLNSNKYYVIDADAGKTENVGSAGEQIRKYHMNISGSASFAQRQDQARKSRDKQLMPKVPVNMKYEMLPVILASERSLNHLPQKTQTEMYADAMFRMS